MHWLWPQYYFASVYVITLIMQIVGLIGSKDISDRISSFIAMAMMVFGIWVLHVGGFW